MQQAQQKPRPLFREVQRFNQIWLWSAIVLVALGLLVQAWRHHLFQHPFAHHTLGEWAIIALLPLIAVGLPIFLSICQQITEVRQDGVYIQVVPFHREFIKISFRDFRRYEMLVYRRIGWGVRYGENGRGYNISGDRGIEFTFHDGRQLMLGSAHVRELLQAIHSQCASPRAPGTLGGRRPN
jgi:hypothetical protein